MELILNYELKIPACRGVGSDVPRFEGLTSESKDYGLFLIKHYFLNLVGKTRSLGLKIPESLIFMVKNGNWSYKASSRLSIIFIGNFAILSLSHTETVYLFVVWQVPDSYSPITATSHHYLTTDRHWLYTVSVPFRHTEKESDPLYSLQPTSIRTTSMNVANIRSVRRVKYVLEKNKERQGKFFPVLGDSSYLIQVRRSLSEVGERGTMWPSGGGSSGWLCSLSNTFSAVPPSDPGDKWNITLFKFRWHHSPVFEITLLEM